MDLISCSTPSWFGGSSIFIVLFFALVTLLIAYYAYKMYRIAKQSSTLYFGLAFLSISISYFIQALFNFLKLKSIGSADLLFLSAKELAVSTIQLSVLAMIMHVLFMVLGFALLAYVTLKERGSKIFLLFVSLSFVAILFTPYFHIVFNLIVAIFLLFIAAQHYQRHAKLGTTTTFLVFSGFSLLFIGHILMVAVNIVQTFYVLAHIITMVGYIVLLVSLLRVVK